MLTLLPGGDSLAQSEGSDGKARAATGSVASQLLSAADESLGPDATLAVLRAYDRGYEVLQIIRAMFDGGLAADGTIADEDGVPVEPFRAPSGLIEGNSSASDATVGGFAAPLHGEATAVVSRFGPDSPSAEAIAIEALETGIAKTTKRLDKKVNLEARAERSDVSEKDAFLAAAVIALMTKGYSPEQIIVDGIAAGGITIRRKIPIEILLVDEDGKELKPDGVEESPEADEAADDLDAFANDVDNLVGGFDPRLAVGERFSHDYRVTIVIDVTDSDGDVWSVEADGLLGPPRDRSLGRALVIGAAFGTASGTGNCSGDSFEFSGPTKLGLSGPVDENAASVSIAMTELDLSGNVPDDCFGNLGLAEDLLKAVTYGPVDVRLRDGASGSAPVSIEDSSGTVKVSIEA